MKTISEVMKKAKRGDRLTDGVRIWHITTRNNPDKVASPILTSGGWDLESFELWAEGSIESVAIIPGLKVVKRKSVR